MSAPAWARLIGQMDRMDFSLAELAQKQTPQSGLRLAWVATFVTKGGTARDWFQAEAPEPFEALSLAAVKILEARAGGSRHKLDDAEQRLAYATERGQRLLDACKQGRHALQVVQGSEITAEHITGVIDDMGAAINNVST